MTPPSMTADAKKKKQFVSADNPVEIFKELGAGIAREASQVPGTILDTAFEQIVLKPQRKPLSGEIELSAGRHQQTQETSVQPDKSASDKLRQLQYVQRQEKEVFSAKQRALEDQSRPLPPQFLRRHHHHAQRDPPESRGEPPVAQHRHEEKATKRLLGDVQKARA